ncbi:hypothetical protein ACJX0J_018781, partial [Zea mays]
KNMSRNAYLIIYIIGITSFIYLIFIRDIGVHDILLRVILSHFLNIFREHNKSIINYKLTLSNCECAAVFLPK